MHKKRILAFSTSYHPFIGGAEIALEEIARRLSKDFDFFIITARLKKNLPKREKRPEGMIIRFGFGIPFDKYLLIPFSLFYYFWKLIKSKDFIIWGMELSHASLAAAFLKFLFPSIPFIFTIQYGYGEERISRGRLGIISYSFRFILHEADYVTAISSHLLALTRKYGYGGQAQLIPNGVDIEKFTSRSVIASEAKQSLTDRHAPSVAGARDDRGPVIITTSRLVPKNGVDTLISAIYEVKKIMPEIQCWILGDGLEKENYKLLIKNYKLEDNVKLLGAVPYDKVPEYLHQACVFARPSRSEGMGNSFVEALAAGLPIIGTPVGGITDIIEDEKTGLFTKPDDPKDLAEKIIHLLGDKRLCQRLVENGRRMVGERFSWDKIALFYEQAFLIKRRVFSILIATPILPPQIGGPAQYAKNLSKEFLLLGRKVSVISFGKYLCYPTGIRHMFYLIGLARQAVKSDLIFALDYTSVGFPAAIISLIFRKPLVIRVEGDFLWENFVERARRGITLREFYRNPPRLNAKEKLIKWVSGWTMRRASKLVFSSEWRRQMIIGAYKIPLGKTEIIQNIFLFAGNPIHRQRGNIILWAGRVLYLKNLERLIKAFASIHGSSYALHLIGDGPEKINLESIIKKCQAEDRIKFFPPMSHQELMDKIVSSAVLVLPSLSDVGPNIVAEAFGAGVPVIMTKESGYAEIFNDAAELVDPLDEDDIHKKLEKFIKEPVEITAPKIIKHRSWADAAQNWINLFEKLI